eukprot:Gregarina_sp_Pseudo_9__400@NODE_1261_length_1733_cov_274_930933_g1186_i0_p1_GENE_NODE_1261_length_1733_cov_274_930933_g1186_i0NODE_1261_length_1733_cov_274_930933_g1186_i0_p1_ORF_typecomplete_len452_score165_34Filament/PF00038_21/0_001Filament/PF00038_21/13Filament/PF00038_21/7_4e03DUF3584/PF12128_8/0_0041HOOK/PF05622_12/0_007AAA_13/PF13166_6/0_053AAA_13/PF13166_6/5_8e02MAD/PF05557_13/0_027Bacillus_HBL/PF05791_11/1_2e03Bacillus_HBL/PF05791_11/0_019Bacillus_HBL/PF05791_11/1_5e02Bacillus_HBL/PF057
MRLLFVLVSLVWAAVAEAEVADVAVASCLCDQVKVEAEAAFKQKMDGCLRDKQELVSSSEQKVAEAKKAAEASLQEAKRALETSKAEAQSLLKEKTVLEKKAAELAAVSDKAKEVETYKAQVGALNTSLQSCKTDMNTKVEACQKDAQSRSQALATAETAIRDLQSAVASSKAVSEQLQQCQSESLKMNAQMEGMSKEHLQKQMKLQSELTGALNNLESLKEDHAKSTNVIYSSEQFSRQVQHGKIVGSAFVKFSHNRLIALVGRNNYDLITLQATVFASAAGGYMRAAYAPVRTRVVTLYHTHGAKLVQPALDRLAQAYDRVKAHVQTRLRQLLTFADNYMNRLIANLASVDPEVRAVFPESFNDRCFAFAFVSLILYILSEVVQWLFSKCVAAPVVYMLGLNQTTKTSKKSGTRAGSKSKSAASTKNASAPVAPSSKDATSKKTKGTKA